MKFEYNYIITTAALAWLVAQVLKTIIYAICNKKMRFERMVGSGGFPSSHSSLVISAAVSIMRVEGPASTEFAIILVFAAIVLYDAMGVRRAAGQQAKAINKILRFFSMKEIETFDDDDSEKPKELKEFLGHTPFEVFGGVVLGIIMAYIVPMTI